ncbi:MAG: hypothetical protein ACE5FR_07370 [Rhodospirillales bacterium]
MYALVILIALAAQPSVESYRLITDMDAPAAAGAGSSSSTRERSRTLVRSAPTVAPAAPLGGAVVLPGLPAALAGPGP